MTDAVGGAGEMFPESGRAWPYLVIGVVGAFVLMFLGIAVAVFAR
jgi:hypothetical protein